MAVTTATVGSEPRRRLVLAAVLVGGVALLVVRPSFGGEPPRAPAPGLADAASLKGLALTTPDAIWWVPRRGPAPTRWQRVSMDTQGMTTLVPLDGLLVAARGRELVVIRTEDGRVERLELPVAAQRDVDATAVLLEDGRMRVAFVADLPPGEPADDGVVSGSGRSGLAVVTLGGDAGARTLEVSTRAIGMTPRNHVALAPDGARVAWQGADGLELGAVDARGGAQRIDVADDWGADVPIAWTLSGIVTLAPDGRIIVADPTTGAVRRVRGLVTPRYDDLGGSGPAPPLGLASTGSRAGAVSFCDLRRPLAPLAQVCTGLGVEPWSAVSSVARTPAGVVVAVVGRTSNGATDARTLLVAPPERGGDVVATPAPTGTREISRLVARA